MLWISLVIPMITRISFSYFFHCSKTCAHSTDIIKLRDCIIINRSDAYHFNYFQTKQTRFGLARELSKYLEENTFLQIQFSIVYLPTDHNNERIHTKTPWVTRMRKQIMLDYILNTYHIWLFYRFCMNSCYQPRDRRVTIS